MWKTFNLNIFFVAFGSFGKNRFELFSFNVEKKILRWNLNVEFYCSNVSIDFQLTLKNYRSTKLSSSFLLLIINIFLWKNVFDQTTFFFYFFNKKILAGKIVSSIERCHWSFFDDWTKQEVKFFDRQFESIGMFFVESFTPISEISFSPNQIFETE